MRAMDRFSLWQTNRMPVIDTASGVQQPDPGKLPGAARFGWLDVLKGISILWVVIFHTYKTRETGYPWVLDPNYFGLFMGHCQPDSWLQSIGCSLGSLFVAVTSLGFHAVDVFLVASGFGLTYAMRSDGPQQNWLRWYGKRLVRLFPMYWLAHLIYLVSPFVARLEALDYRFLLSFLGDRIYPIDSTFYYANASWWYFGLLLQLYLVFPLLFILLRKTGITRFLLCAGLITLATREVLLQGLEVSGLYLAGGFFGTRLWQFALGMALAALARSKPQQLEEMLFSPWTLLAGIVIYGLALASNFVSGAYVVTEPLIGTGLFILLAHLARAIGHWRRLTALLAFVGAYSYGLYLLHQPYVIYFGAHMGDVGIVAYMLWSIPVIALITICSITLERWVNGLSQRVAARFG